MSDYTVDKLRIPGVYTVFKHLEFLQALLAVTYHAITSQ